MAGPEAHNHARRLPSDMDNGQRGMDAEQMQQQQLKLRERQRFFEEVFQHDVDFFFPVSHLQIEHRRPPLGSISSMEVNVDMLEQMDMMDLSDQDTVDVFLSCGAEDNNNVATLLPGSGRGSSGGRSAVRDGRPPPVCCLRQPLQLASWMGRP